MSRSFSLHVLLPTRAQQILKLETTACCLSLGNQPHAGYFMTDEAVPRKRTWGQRWLSGGSACWTSVRTWVWPPAPTQRLDTVISICNLGGKGPGTGGQQALEKMVASECSKRLPCKKKNNKKSKLKKKTVLKWLRKILRHLASSCTGNHTSTHTCTYTTSTHTRDPHLGCPYTVFYNPQHMTWAAQSTYWGNT